MEGKSRARTSSCCQARANLSLGRSSSITACSIGTVQVEVHSLADTSVCNQTPDDEKGSATAILLQPGLCPPASDSENAKASVWSTRVLLTCKAPNLWQLTVYVLPCCLSSACVLLLLVTYQSISLLASTVNLTFSYISTRLQQHGTIVWATMPSPFETHLPITVCQKHTS